MLLGLCVALALGVMAPLRAIGAGNDPAMLKRIASKIDGRTGVVTIEATSPVPYVASQPDPKTFVVELRDVVAVGFENQFFADPRHPIAAIQVENAAASDGTVIARVRMTLDQPMRPKVRSTRNVIYVEAERAESAPAAAAAARSQRQAASAAVSMTGPSPAIRDLRVQKRGEATAVTLLGTSRLIATSVIEPKDGPRRVVINFPNVTSSLPSTNNVGQGPVQRVRIGFDPKAPLMTQVTVDLSRTAPYRVESSPDGNDLTLVFDEPVADPFSALQTKDASTTARSTATAAPAAPVAAPAARTVEPVRAAASAVVPVQKPAAAQAPATQVTQPEPAVSSAAALHRQSGEP